jgi:hypothetical protein
MPEAQMFRVNRLYILVLYVYYEFRTFIHERTTFHQPRYITHKLLLPVLLGSPIHIDTLFRLYFCIFLLSFAFSSL